MISLLRQILLLFLIIFNKVVLARGLVIIRSLGRMLVILLLVLLTRNIVLHFQWPLFLISSYNGCSLKATVYFHLCWKHIIFWFTVINRGSFDVELVHIGSLGDKGHKLLSLFILCSFWVLDFAKSLILYKHLTEIVATFENILHVLTVSSNS